jgi:hypothetical protein
MNSKFLRNFKAAARKAKSNGGSDDAEISHCSLSAVSPR